MACRPPGRRADVMVEPEWWRHGEWPAGDPAWMYQALEAHGGLSERKLRLFVCACCRRAWDLITRDLCRDLLGVAERRADGEVSEQEWSLARGQIQAAVQATPDGWDGRSP